MSCCSIIAVLVDVIYRNIIVIVINSLVVVTSRCCFCGFIGDTIRIITFSMKLLQISINIFPILFSIILGKDVMSGLG